MKVGKYQIGRFHAIIRKEYADGSVDYETSFTDIEDFNESYYCILKCIGKEVGIATDNPKVLTYACVIRGKEEIEKEIGTCRNRLRRDPADFQAQWIPELEKLVTALEFGDDDAIYEAVCNAEARQIRLTTYAAMELAEDEWFFRNELERVGFEPPNRNGTVAYMAQQALDFSVHLESMEDHGYAVSSDNNIA